MSLFGGGVRRHHYPHHRRHPTYLHHRNYYYGHVNTIEIIVLIIFKNLNSVQNTLLSVAIITVKRKYFFAHTSSATLNNVLLYK